MSLVANIHHVSLNVADIERSHAFYVDILGLKVLDRPDLGFAGRWLEVGAGRQVHLLELDRIPQDVGQHFAFEVTNIEEACAHVRSHGIEVTDPQPIGSALQAFFHDPDGNRIEFNQPAG